MSDYLATPDKPSVQAKAGQLKPELRIAQAVAEFEAELSKEQKAVFRTMRQQTFLASATPSTHDVMQFTADIDRRLSGGQCFGPRFTSFLRAVQQFAALEEIVVGGSRRIVACAVWSLVHMSLLVIAVSILHNAVVRC